MPLEIKKNQTERRSEREWASSPWQRGLTLEEVVTIRKRKAYEEHMRRLNELQKLTLANGMIVD
jgi:hypothetical protein